MSQDPPGFNNGSGANMAPDTPGGAEASGEDVTGARDIADAVTGKAKTVEKTPPEPPPPAAPEPENVLNGLLARAPFIELAYYLANRLYSHQPERVRMRLLRRHHKRLLWACIAGDFMLRAVVVVLLVALAYKGIAPLPKPW